MQGQPTRRRRWRLATIALLAIAGSLTATAAASAAPALTVSTANGAGGTVVVSGTGFAQSYTPAPGTGAPTPNAGFYLAQGVVSGGTVKLGTATKWISSGNAATATRDALAGDGSFTTTLPVTTTLDSGNVDCKTTTCIVLAWPAQSNPSATGLIATADLAFGPSLTATPASVASGDAVTLTGTGFAQAYTPAPGTGAPTPNAGFYVAQGAVVNGAFKVGSASKWLNPTNVAPTATQDKLNPDGSFSTTLSIVDKINSGATDCTSYACFVFAWPAQSNPTPANLIVLGSTVAVTAASSGAGGGGSAGGTPAISVSPASGLSTAGPTAVGVSGSGFSATANGGIGVYVMYGPVSATAQGDFYSAKWVAPGNAPGADTDTMSSTGTFSTTVSVVPSYIDGSGRFVNCTVAQCAIRTIAAHGSADRSFDTTATISFAGTVASQASTPVASPNLVPDAAGQTPGQPTSSDSSAPAQTPKLGTPSVGKDGKVSLKVSERSTVTFVLRKKIDGKWKVVKTIRVKAAGAGTVGAKLPVSAAGRYRISIKAVSSVTGKSSKTTVKTVTVKKAKSAKRA